MSVPVLLRTYSVFGQTELKSLKYSLLARFIPILPTTFSVYLVPVTCILKNMSIYHTGVLPAVVLGLHQYSRTVAVCNSRKVQYFFIRHTVDTVCDLSYEYTARCQFEMQEPSVDLP